MQEGPDAESAEKRHGLFYVILGEQPHPTTKNVRRTFMDSRRHVAGVRESYARFAETRRPTDERDGACQGDCCGTMAESRMTLA